MSLPQARLYLRRLLCYWLPPILWMALIFALSAQPTLPELDEPWLDVLLKKTAHFLEYAILAFLWWRALNDGNRHTVCSLIIAGLVSVLYAVSDEYHQTFVAGRHGWPGDVGIDSAGVLVMLEFIRWRGRTA